MAEQGKFRSMTERIQDPIQADAAVEVFLAAATEALVSEEGWDKENADIAIRFVGLEARQAKRYIFKHSESPLETTFHMALLLGLLKWDPFGFMWTPAFDEDVTEVMSIYRQQHDQVLTIIDDYKAKTGESTLWPMLRSLTDPNNKMFGEFTGMVLQHAMEESFGTWDAFHLTPQPKFKSIRVDGRTIRADALVWVPSDPNYRVVLECDGYEYHSDKPRFTTDRRRDRVLATNGYRVMRFSGAEVFEDPVATAVEAYDFLKAQRTHS